MIHVTLNNMFFVFRIARPREIFSREVAIDGKFSSTVHVNQAGIDARKHIYLGL